MNIDPLDFLVGSSNWNNPFLYFTIAFFIRLYLYMMLPLWPFVGMWQYVHIKNIHQRKGWRPLKSTEIFYPMRLGSLGKRSSRPKWLNVSESLMTRLLPKLGTPSWSASHSTYSRCLDRMRAKPSSTTLRIPIYKFLVWVEQLNSYLKTLPCLYYSLSAN